MTLGWILLTNDDGVDSPALVPFARSLADLGEVRVVVPDGERSWSGKSITRFDPVRMEAVERGGMEMLAHSGTPADGVQIAGIHFETRPSLVVSGINLGYNHGAGYLWSSGTFGAAVEGWVGGIPSVAVSTGTMSGWSEWRRSVHAEAAVARWVELADVGAEVVESLVDAAGAADVWSVNMPWESTPQTPRRVTRVAQTSYDSLFAKRGVDTFVHDFGGGLEHRSSVDGNDVQAAHDGVVSITPIQMPRAAEVDRGMVERLERG